LLLCFFLHKSRFKLLSERAELESLHHGVQSPAVFTLLILATRLLQNSLLVDLGMRFFKVVAMLIVEGLFSLSCFFKMLWGLLCESPKLRIKTSYNGLKTTVNLVVVDHENLAHLLFVVFTIEYTAARRHSLLSIFASKVSRHYDLFVVGTVCAWFLRATKLVKSASL